MKDAQTSKQVTQHVIRVRPKKLPGGTDRINNGCMPGGQGNL